MLNFFFGGEADFSHGLFESDLGSKVASWVKSLGLPGNEKEVSWKGQAFSAYVLASAFLEPILQTAYSSPRSQLKQCGPNQSG